MCSVSQLGIYARRVTAAYAKNRSKGPTRGPDGKKIPPAGKLFDGDFGAVAHWDNGQIVEECLFCDLVTFVTPIGRSTSAFMVSI